MPLTLQRIPRTGRGFIEPRLEVGKALPLHMVLIPEGTFLMGSPDDEPERSKAEGPQHQVDVSKFFMGRYPVTQSQWRVVAAIRKVEIDLDPSPFRFKGDNLPVEQVSWYESVEFCQRLARHTGRAYRLPTEAEWEYACRAGTTTPFNCGDTISTEAANYDGNYAYGDSPLGDYRKTTTPVDQLDNANAYGLSDLHGNVYEWCEDDWHGRYNGASLDGSAWIDRPERGGSRVLRGGTYWSSARHCRVSYRDPLSPGRRDASVGFRLASSGLSG